MVQNVRRKGRDLFRCESCGFHYRDEGAAAKCEAWCTRHKSCNILITRDAIENQPPVPQRSTPKLLSALGAAGCVSCYAAHFPAIAGLIGILGISAGRLIPFLEAYAASPFFVPVLVASVFLLVIGTTSLGRAAYLMAIAAGAAMIASMTVYLRAWLFIFALVLFGGAHVVGALHATGTKPLRGALLAAMPFILVALLLGLATILAGPETMSSMTAPSMLRMEQ